MQKKGRRAFRQATGSTLVESIKKSKRTSSKFESEWEKVKTSARKGSVYLINPTSGSKHKSRVVNLKRGGCHVTLSNDVVVQFCCPPHSIKDCMNEGLPVPFSSVSYKISTSSKVFPSTNLNFHAISTILSSNAKSNFLRSRASLIESGLSSPNLVGPSSFDLMREFLPQYRHLMPDLAWEGKSVAVA